MINRRTVLTSSTAAALAGLPLMSQAQGKKDSLVFGMALEPAPGLDPTGGAASAISEVTLYNVFETLTRINSDGTVSPLLAESWEVSPDLRTYTFRLRKGVKFHNGEPMNAAAVKFSFDRAGTEKSTNKDKRVFAAFTRVSAVDEHTVVVINSQINPNFLFAMGQGTAAIVEPKSAEGNATKPVGTGPYQVEAWNKGSSVVLAKWDAYRNAAAIKFKKVTFRFISDPAAQAAALLSGDVDVFPRIGTRAVPQFKANPRFQVLIGNSQGKTILTINNKKKPLDDIRVRRAILAAIDRKAVIEGAADGFGSPIGSHYVRGLPGFIDTTGINPFNIEKAKALLAEAGVSAVELNLYCLTDSVSQSTAQIIQASLGEAGITVNIQPTEDAAYWALGDKTQGDGYKNIELVLMNFAGGIDPTENLVWFRPDQIGVYNWSFFDSKEFEDLYQKGLVEQDDAKRKEIFNRMEDLMEDSGGFIFVCFEPFLAIYRSDIKPVILADGHPDPTQFTKA